MIPNKIPVAVYSIRDGLNLRSIRERITYVELQRIHPGALYGALSEHELIFVFKSGGMVLVNVPEDKHDQLLVDFGLDSPAKAHVETEEFAEDDLAIELRAGELKVHFNTIVLPEWNRDMFFIIAWVMAQSGSLELIERDVERVLQHSEKLSRSIRSSKWNRFKRQELLNILADILETRHDIVGQLKLFDEPEMTWENEACDRLYRSLFEHYDLKARADKVEQMLAISADTGELQLELLHTWRAEFMEIIIIVLIAVEVFKTVSDMLDLPGVFASTCLLIGDLCSWIF